jgi:hypothetical protein
MMRVVGMVQLAYTTRRHPEIARDFRPEAEARLERQKAEGCQLPPNLTERGTR